MRQGSRSTSAGHGRLLSTVATGLTLGICLWAGVSGPIRAAAATTYYFHGTAADQVNRTNSAPTATFNTTPPTGTTDVLQTGDDPVANEAVPENPFIIYWESTALTGTLSGAMNFDWWWSASPADLALVDAIDISVYADPTGTTGTLISGTSGINLPLNVGPTAVENHNTVTVSGTVTTKLLIQVRQHFTNEGTTNTVHYDSTAAPSSFTVGATVSTPTPTATATVAPTPTPSSGNQGPQLFYNYQSPYPYPHNPTNPPFVSFLFGEPSLGVDWVTNDTMYQGDLNTWRIHFDYGPTPPTATWNDRSHPVTSTTSLDPRLITDHLGFLRGTDDRTIVDQLLNGNSAQTYSDTDGGTSPPPGNSADWVASMGGGFPQGPDHESTGSGPYHLPLPTGASPSVYQHAVYYCSQAELLNNQMGPIDFCSRSDTGGATYGAGVATWTQAQCGGLHGKPRVGPDGTVYLPNKDCTGAGSASSAKGLVISSDNGATWVVHNIPNTSTDGNQSDPDVAVGGSTGKGTVYYGYRDGDHKAKVVVSNDDGNTWSTPFDAGAAFGIQNAQFAAVIAGDQNRAAFSFIGTTTPTTSTNGQGDPGDDVSDNFGCPSSTATGCGAVWHAYTAFTYDGGLTWQTVDDTPNLPVQRGGVCMNGTGCTGNDRNMLDFNDSNIDRFGRVQIAYTDGCTASCETNPAAPSCSVGNQNCTGKNSSVYSVLDQVCGKGLFANTDPGFFDDVSCPPTPLPLPNVPETPIMAGVIAGGMAAIGIVMIFRRRRSREVEVA